MRKLIRLPEPKLLFAHGQALEDPRDGLTLFGPLDQGKPYGIQGAVIGTRSGIGKFRKWVDGIQRPVRLQEPVAARPPFPGFEAAFRIPWQSEPLLTFEIDETELKAKAGLDDRAQRVFQTVDLFAKIIANARQNEEVKPDVWFIVIPDYVRRYCRPEGIVDPADRQVAVRYFGSARQAKSAQREPFLFAEMNEAAEQYQYKEHFRNQLKARLLSEKVSTQVIREGTLDNLGSQGDSTRAKAMEKLQSQIVWNIATAAFYKTGGRPWKVAGIREGVCYVGLVFKKDDRGTSARWASCGAQMFLDSGDGLVFKGAPGNWFNAQTKDFHLDYKASKELVTQVIEGYKQKQENKTPPKELFIHGRVSFSREEWAGFLDGAGSTTTVVGVKIRDDASLKLFRKTDTPILRGTAYIRNDRSAYLWTRGWTPRLATYPGLEVPNPLTVEICQGEAPIETVLADVLALTKLNYNSCQFADGSPITLKFADAVGEVLTAGPVKSGGQPLPFMYYI